jgi:hypothetical protein
VTSPLLPYHFFPILIRPSELAGSLYQQSQLAVKHEKHGNKWLLNFAYKAFLSMLVGFFNVS